MDWKSETFKVGNKEISYVDVIWCDSKLDINGNPIFNITLKDGTKYKIDGSQAYQFDMTRVIDSNYARRQLGI